MLGQLGHRYPISALFIAPRFEGFNVWVLVQRLAHGLAQLAGAFAVDDTHEGQSGQEGRVQVAIQGFDGLIGALPAQVIAPDLNRDGVPDIVTARATLQELPFLTGGVSVALSDP